MTWLLNLAETYEFHEKEVGEVRKNRFNREYMLLPIAHTTQNAHIEVVLTEEGEFHSASVIEKEDATTILPSTVDSASRAGAAVAPYALHDKLNYTAGDFTDYGGKIGRNDPYKAYVDNLKKWVDSPGCHPKVQAIYEYVKKGRLIQDLVEDKVIYLDENQKMIKKWNKEYEKLYERRPSIFTIVPGNQESAFVRFRVHSPHENLTPPWRDKEVFESFLKFYPQQVGNESICFVTGKELPTTEKHANKIRHAGDKAKLISSNDTSGFTFRGRFNKSEEVASISYDISQKAHNALKWLIEKQGTMIDERVFLIWGNVTLDLGTSFDSSYQFGQSFNAPVIAHTSDAFAKEFSKAIDGYKNDLKYDSDVNILIIDSATTGRMGVLYYRNLNKEVYFERVKKWHTTCVWRHSYVEDNKRKFFIGAPATKDIAVAAYGPRVNDKLIKGTIERLLPCIIDGHKVPNDIVRSTIQRASNPVSMEKWEWEKTLSIACSLINKKERLGVTLDINNEDRDYLFGRMLAVADVLERRAMQSGEQRETNAIRYMNAFAKHPERTWKVIQESLQPYQMRLGPRAVYLTKIIDEIASKIKFEDFNNRPLSGKYLLGLYSQRHELYQKNEKTVEENE